MLKTKLKMATLNVPQNGKAVKGSSRKPILGVDLTAMVDLAFLLITFFMLTTSLSKMDAMEIAKPVPVEEFADYPASKTMTILLGKDNQVVYYMGEADKTTMHVSDFSHLREALLTNKRLVANVHAKSSDKELLVIIKPTSTSVYRNFVDVLDEMHINKINSYAIDDKYILGNESRFMEEKGI